jgi:hypothetical protein
MKNNKLLYDNILTNTNNVSEDMKVFYNRIASDIELGKIYKLPEHLSVLDILRIKSPYKPLLASYYGYTGLLKLLVENGYDLNITNLDNENCLLIASCKGQFEIIDYLLENGFNINYVNRLNENCYLMGSNESIQFLEYLEKKGADIYHMNRYNENAIVYCIMKNNIKNIKYLIEQKKFIAKSHNDIDLIVRACYYNSVDIVKYFVQFIRNPNMHESYYWALIHNNKEIYETLILEYGDQITQKKHEMTLFQNSTNLFIRIYGTISKKFKEKYNGILRWSILNYLEDKNDINNITTTDVSTIMILITTGNLQLIDYYQNKYSFDLNQRSVSHNDLYTLSICNKSHNVVKYLSLIGLEMDFININYLNYKKIRYCYDIYMLYYNYLKNIKLVIDDEDNKVISFKQLNNINYIDNEIPYDCIDMECAICKDRFIHMDEIIKCNKNHMYHTSCLLLSLNNNALKFSDCFICFQKNLLRSSNLFIWFTKPDMKYLKNQKEEQIKYMKFIDEYNKKEFTNLIYPVTIQPEQYPYMLSDLSVKENQDTKIINQKSYDMAYTTTTHVKNILENSEYNASDNKILCDNLDISWINLYKSLIETDEELHGEELTNIINQIDSNVALGQNNNNSDLSDNAVIENVVLTNINIANSMLNYNGLTSEDDYNGMDNEGDYNGMDNEGDYNGMDNDGDYNGMDNDGDYNGMDNEGDYNGMDNEGDYNEMSSDEYYNNIDNMDEFNETNSNTDYTHINAMLNDAYYRHMMINIIIERLIKERYQEF